MHVLQQYIFVWFLSGPQWEAWYTAIEGIAVLQLSLLQNQSTEKHQYRKAPLENKKRGTPANYLP